MTASPDPAQTGAQALAAMLGPTDRLEVSAAGDLMIEGRAARDLLAAHGSPLVVTVERTILDNLAAIRAAFTSRWPGPVEVLYSFKCNNSLAIRALLSRAGAGGDCFGENELRATLEAGTPPQRVALNGSDKSPSLIRAALDAGVVVNIDGEDEIGFIEERARALGRRAVVNLRLKVLPADLPAHAPVLARRAADPLDWVRRAKWGYTLPRAEALVRRLLASDAIDLAGYSCHVGHLSNRPGAFAAVARAFGEAVAALGRATGHRPRVLDLGGGWARAREPEQGPPSDQPPEPGAGDIAAQAEAATAALRAAIAGLDIAPALWPALWIEPGRYLVGNADVLLASAGAIKHDAGHRWLHLDISTNFLPRIETGQFHYRVLAAGRMHDPCDTVYEIVGETCFRSVIGSGRRLPPMRRGDIVAIPDAGMYSWSLSNTLNCVPRPANVMLGPKGRIDLVRRREDYADLFATQSVPARHRPDAAPQEVSPCRPPS